MYNMIPGLYECFNHWHKDRGTVWIYSDPHFGDKDIIAGAPADRPSDEDQIKIINSKVGKKDTLIILGDIGNIECAKKLKGYKILIAGNHDKGLTAYKEVFDEVYAGPLFIGEKLLLSHEPINIPFAFNIHGHVHDRKHKNDKTHFNVCSDVIQYTPINFNQWMKQGYLSNILSIHRETINKAIVRKKKRKEK